MSDVTLQTDLLSEIEAFCERRCVAVTRFGLAVANDGHLVHKLRAGNSNLTLATVDRIRKFMAEDAPIAAPKPRGRRRPEAIT